MRNNEESGDTAQRETALATHSAPGSNAGFSFQFERALLRLAESTAGFTVGIETDDDVAVRSPTGEIVLEQAKHSIQESGQPFGDRSKDLWNTLATWMDALKNNEVEIASTSFFMVTNKAICNCIACDIAAADSPEKSDACIDALISASKNPPEKIAKLIPRVLDENSRHHLRGLIQKCELIDATSASAIDSIRRCSPTMISRSSASAL